MTSISFQIVHFLRIVVNKYIHMWIISFVHFRSFSKFFQDIKKENSTRSSRCNEKIIYFSFLNFFRDLNLFRERSVYYRFREIVSNGGETVFADPTKSQEREMHAVLADVG